MASDWVPWSKGLAKKPEVIAIAKAVGSTRREVASTLMEFWEWADDETADGQIRGVSISDLPGVVAETSEAFWNAVAKAGWLQVVEGGIYLPNFRHWMGKSAKLRLQAVIRKRLSRLVRDQQRTEQRTENSSSAAAAEPDEASMPTTGDSREAEQMVRELVKRGLSTTQATRHAETAHPTLLRVVLAYFDSGKVRVKKSAVAVLNSMIRKPGDWGFEQVGGEWRPPADATELPESAQARAERIAADQEMVARINQEAERDKDAVAQLKAKRRKGGVA